MKISIITVTLNSDKTLRDTLNSVLSQKYKNIEHIIVDGGSQDQTKAILKKYPNKNKKIYTHEGSGIYAAINYGIKKSKGNFITVLNSDDFYQSEETITNVVKKIKNNKKIKIFFGNVAYFNELDYYNIKRFYSVDGFKPWQMKFGLMPPHPGSFIKKDIYQKNGLYNEDFKIASDFEFFLKNIYINKIKYKSFNETIVRMRLGGISSKNIFSYITSTNEIWKSFKLNNLSVNLISLILRFPWKINQLFIYNTKKINKKFQIFKIFFDKDQLFINNFNLINNFNKIPFRKNFILSAMNLAFLGYFAAGKLNPHNNLYHWVDGIWAEKYTNLKKKPGRDLLRYLKVPKNIKNILIIGNVSDKSKRYLNKKFKLKISNIKLPYGPIEVLKKKKIKIPSNTLTFITLPTPKQEQIAMNLTKYNANYQIICIGASLAIVSGEEKEVPNILKNYEFLWRLRTDTIRRLLRLLETIYYYTKGVVFLKKYIKTSFRKFD